MYELVSASQTNRWQQILDFFNISDIYYTCEYIGNALKLDPGEAALFYYIDDAGEGEIAYPFIKRQLNDEGSVFYDITSPFGYGGPLLKVKGDGNKLASSFRAAFSVFCQAESIVAEFVRFHPLMQNAEFFKEEMDLIPVTDTVTLELHQDMEKEKASGNEDGQQEHHSSFEVRKLGTVKHMFDFLVLYYSTIRQNEETDSYYFFTNDYFESLVSAMGPNLHLFGAYRDNQLLTASYLLTKGDIIYHHLNGKLAEEEALEAEGEMLAAIARWGAENNYRYFHIAAKQEALLRKADSNRKLSKSTYFIARKVHEPKIYSDFHPIKDSEMIKRYGNI